VIDRIASWLSAGELVILFLTAPLFLFIRPSLAPVLLLVPLLWIARRVSYGHFVPRTPADWSVLGLLAMALVSIFVTFDLESSLDKVTGLVYGVAVFYGLVTWGLRKRSPLSLAVLVATLGAGTAFLSLLGTQWNVKWSMMSALKPYLPQLISNLPGAELGFNPNTVSGTLITFVPLQICLLWALASQKGFSSPRMRWLALGVGLSLALTSTVISLAQSRAAWATLILGLLTMAGVLAKRVRGVLFLAVVLGVIALAAIGPVGVTEWLAGQGWMTESAEASWAARTERWSRWLWAIAEFPLTGMGMDTFRWSGWQRYPFFHTRLSGDLGHAHNGYLQIALDLGIPGLVSYLALLGGTLILGWQSYRRSVIRLTSLITLGSIAGLAIHAAWSVLDALPLGARTNFLWWTVLAMAVASIVRDKDWNQPEPIAAWGQSAGATEPGDA
jgi:putative inorganic carbon (HCO3(-)) transporter